MKANELMIGDWARQSDGGIINIMSIDKQEDGYWQARGADRLLVEGGDLEPIPLTAEILEKNGFTKSNVFIEWKYEEEGIYILWKPFPFLKIETENVQLNLSGCEYVHELQHALRLCGLSELADNFKV